MEKVCTRCKTAKAVTEFYKYPTGTSRPTCKTCHKAQVRSWEKKNPERIKYKNTRRKYYQKSNYGIEHGTYEMMLKEQDFACAICRSKLSKRKGKEEAFQIDHCHATKIVRGLLCHHCNMGLGFFRDDPKIIEAAAKYLVIDRSPKGSL